MIKPITTPDKMFKLNPTITLENMDKDAYIMLAQQKLALLELTTDNPDHILNGLIHLIDSIQDQCVDKNDIPDHIIFPIPYLKGTPILSRDGKFKGTLTGETKDIEGYPGKMITVIWDDGKKSTLCTAGMIFENDTWKII